MHTRPGEIKSRGLVVATAQLVGQYLTPGGTPPGADTAFLLSDFPLRLLIEDHPRPVLAIPPTSIVSLARDAGRLGIDRGFTDKVS